MNNSNLLASFELNDRLISHIVGGVKFWFRGQAFNLDIPGDISTKYENNKLFDITFPELDDRNRSYFVADGHSLPPMCFFHPKYPLNENEVDWFYYTDMSFDHNGEYKGGYYYDHEETHVRDNNLLELLATTINPIILTYDRVHETYFGREDYEHTQKASLYDIMPPNRTQIQGDNIYITLR